LISNLTFYLKRVEEYEKKEKNYVANSNKKISAIQTIINELLEKQGERGNPPGEVDAQTVSKMKKQIGAKDLTTENLTYLLDLEVSKRLVHMNNEVGRRVAMEEKHGFLKDQLILQFKQLFPDLKLSSLEDGRIHLVSIFNDSHKTNKPLRVNGLFPEAYHFTLERLRESLLVKQSHAEYFPSKNRRK